MSSCYDELIRRNLIYHISDEGLIKRLNAGEIEPITFYIGFDPTSHSLHVGHLLQIMLIIQLLKFGHKPIVVLGGATALIGDPSGRATERPIIEESQVMSNVEKISTQLEGILNNFELTTDEKITVCNNLSWWKDMNVVAYLRDVGRLATVNQMLAKESVHRRVSEENQSISYAEFSYMLLQAYDFLHLYRTENCTLQCGASDQWGNISQGLDLIRRSCGDEKVFGLTTPLVVKPDGTKFGKSSTGTVWLDGELTRPFELYQYFINIDDLSVITFLKYFTFLTVDEIESIEKESTTRPKDRIAHKRLSYEVVKNVHGKEIAENVQAASNAIFGTAPFEELSDDVFELLMVELNGISVNFKDLRAREIESIDSFLVSFGVVKSKSEVGRLITQKGLMLNENKDLSLGTKISEIKPYLGKYIVIKVGKKNYSIVKVL